MNKNIKNLKILLEDAGFYIEIDGTSLCGYHDDMNVREVKNFMDSLLSEIKLIDGVEFSCRHYETCGTHNYEIIEGNFKREGLWKDLYGETIKSNVIGF